MSLIILYIYYKANIVLNTLGAHQTSVASQRRETFQRQTTSRVSVGCSKQVSSTSSILSNLKKIRLLHLIDLSRNKLAATPCWLRKHYSLYNVRCCRRVSESSIIDAQMIGEF